MNYLTSGFLNHKLWGSSANTDMVRQRWELGQALVPIPPLKQTNKHELSNLQLFDLKLHDLFHFIVCLVHSREKMHNFLKASYV